MFKNKKFFIIALMLAASIPLSVSASWFWGNSANQKNISTITNQTAELSDAGKTIADAKYKIWEAGFEKKNVDSVIANADTFWFTVPELNYLFASVGATVKKPLLSDFKLTDDNNILSVSATFKKFIQGKISFTTQIANDNNKIKLNISKARFFGIPVPSAWFSNPLNKGIDEYLAFLYKDSRYQGFSFSNENGIIKIRPEFK
jgi:hypothetical protein